jgi:predicted ribosome quality control (RQC) complex YloA/Tae2 family protein
MILLVGLYRDPSPARMNELVEVLRRNLRNDRLEEVHVFVEDRLDPGTIP